MSKDRTVRLGVCVLFALLSACGGGGSGGSAPAPVVVATGGIEPPAKGFSVFLQKEMFWIYRES